MKLSKRLLAGSMALALGLGNLHAAKGSTTNQPRGKAAHAATKSSSNPYRFCIFERENLRHNLHLPKILVNKILSNITAATLPIYKQINWINDPYYNETHAIGHHIINLKRDTNFNPISLNFVDTLRESLDRLFSGETLTNQEKNFIEFFEDMLIVNDVFNSKIKEVPLKNEIYCLGADIEATRIAFGTSCWCDFEYCHQVFPIPLEKDSSKIYLPEFKHMLSHLLKHLGTLTILLSDNLWAHLQELDTNTGNCTFIKSNGEEVHTNISSLVKVLEDKKSKVLNVHFLDIKPKDTEGTITHSSGLASYWDREIYSDSEDESDSENEPDSENESDSDSENE